MMEQFDEIIEAVNSFSPEEKTELVCAILDDSCLDPHQVFPCLGLEAGFVDELANKNREFFESEYFCRKQLDCISTEVIRNFVNKFNAKNQ